ncbi:NADP-dependent oxidoreductase [Bacillus luteolus]|uniref:NADP-dependent oxidoreductase n=1 Tax=Litchfieldia luteola TaxID=682179 RepID=A0ABR9QEV7_9BACI|nr:NADP-dependent oxidoreductase [Cytobacillus luteolus]MBE4907030.1 NADP-dependent oxidoreductase [Cytobacillus luteolus]MBP1943503.1 2-desacetyl-2-hydroxyethyl bacteriochlorophyllide A dehydrogenase [Cytobacillus luteolus]
MRAIAIENYGGIEQLKEIEAPLPEVGPKDILIEVYASAINPVDIAIREGYFKERVAHEFPVVLGYDVAGVVAAVGSDIKKFKVGDEVYSYTSLDRNGTYAEFVAVNEEFVALKPSNLSFVEAASVPLVGITAWHALVKEAIVKEGQKVLVLGGSGGVGSFAVQLAKAQGAIVSATTSTKNSELVKELGADFVLDYTKESLPASEYDVIFDTVGGYQIKELVGATKEDGKIISITSRLSPTSQQLVDAKGIHYNLIFSSPDGESLDQLSTLLSKGKIRPVVGTIFSLSDVKEAHLLSESKRAVGKIVIQVK